MSIEITRRDLLKTFLGGLVGAGVGKAGENVLDANKRKDAPPSRFSCTQAGAVLGAGLTGWWIYRNKGGDTIDTEVPQPIVKRKHVDRLNEEREADEKRARGE